MTTRDEDIRAADAYEAKANKALEGAEHADNRDTGMWAHMSMAERMTRKSAFLQEAQVYATLALVHATKANMPYSPHI